jgi:hypothetical protein
MVGRSFLHDDGEPVGPALFEPVVTLRPSKAAVAMRQRAREIHQGQGQSNKLQRYVAATDAPSSPIATSPLRGGFICGVRCARYRGVRQTFFVAGRAGIIATKGRRRVGTLQTAASSFRVAAMTATLQGLYHFWCDEVMVRVDGVHSLPAETLLLLQNETDLAVRA